MTLRLILGDQLNHQHSWYTEVDDQVVYCLCETRSETTYVKHHVQKIVAFFLAMRHFAQELERQGHRVIYRKLGEAPEQSITDNVAALIKATGADHFEYQLPDEYRLDEELRDFCASLDLPTAAVDTEHFFSARQDVKQLFGKKAYLMETFYRAMRRRHDVLMEPNGDPLTGQWNYDHDNRGKLPKELHIPPTVRFVRDVSEVVELLEREKIPTMGRIQTDAFDYPVTRAEALETLTDFCANRLVHFGTYQDALTDRDPLLFHSRISFAMNVKLVSPREVVDAAIQEWEGRKEEISYNQLEGFVRQIIGWREYMRGVYWAKMPDYEALNFFGHDRKLPSWYWTGKTKMNCLNHAINQSLDTAYAHHIQRLMVTGNFALLIGAHPDEVDAWYLGVYVDALQWVEITNTRGMSQWADGGLLATKPYVSSANYINKMGDYCKGCYYDYKAKSGPRACPFNSLYWDFIDRHADKLSQNFRMKMIYRVWSKYDQDTQAELLKHAAWVKDNLETL